MQLQSVQITRRTLCAAGLAAACALALGAPRARAGQLTAAEPAAPALPAPVEVSFPLTVVDDQGRKVTVESLDRVVACMGSFAKTWELAGGTLVGVTSDTFDYGGYDLACAEQLSLVGDFTEPNLEQILVLEPTLVIMSSSTSGKGGKASQVDLVPVLEAAGIPTLTFNVTLFEDYLRMLRTCCDLTGREDLYQLHGLDVEARIAAVVEAASAEATKLDEAPTCLLMTTYSGGTRVSTATSQAGAILADLGARNLADEMPSLLRDFSLESVIALDPTFIFALPMGNDAAAAERALRDQTEANPAWAALTAVNEGRYVLLDPALFLYKPLDAWDEAYRVIAAALYGPQVLGGLPLPPAAQAQAVQLESAPVDDQAANEAK